MRTALPGATIAVRHNDRTYTGVRGLLESAEIVDEIGALQTVTGSIALLISELASVWPAIGDKIELKSTESGEWETRLVTATRQDETGATRWIGYGERYD